MKEELRLPELQKANLKCVFCGVSNQSAEGGYYKGRFLCRKCNQDMKNIDSYLGL